MQGAPPPPDRNSLILALARDNRAEDLKKAIAAGIPVSYANRVRDSLQCKHWNGLLDKSLMMNTALLATA